MDQSSLDQVRRGIAGPSTRAAVARMTAEQANQTLRDAQARHHRIAEAGGHRNLTTQQQFGSSPTSGNTTGLSPMLGNLSFR
jgi:hypothetical protein